MHTTVPHNLSLRRRAGKRCRPLLAAAVLAVAPATAGEVRVGPPAPGVHVGVPDIRGDLIRRMREGRPLEPPPDAGDEAAAAETDIDPAPEAASAREGPDTATAPREAPARKEAPPRQRPVYIPPPRRDERTDDGHVPVPKKTLTIRQLRDVDRLTEELERARQRRGDGSE